ncbi:glycerophosphoryl diester phosphodiesterase membrane domain-containing protein [Streptomyces sp. NPDC005907]|uniref:glycerophosphoryl diester phosphodiesterase membrane domain-containing protein n=1 Tax=Streptomyces sp. NPDC005907 TaxID=3154571 RepID=UPI0034093CAA
MNDTPGWASPGSAPSDGQEPDRTGPAQPTDPHGTDPADPPSKWSKEQPPPGRWTAPAPKAPPQAPPPPPQPGQGWGAPPSAGPGGPGYGAPGYGVPGPGPGAGYGGPGYGGPGGYAGPGGWGGNWGGPPPAAKPGVIPLRPLGVGEILDGAVSTMRTYWRTVLGISLTVAVVTEVIVVLLRGLVLDDRAGSDVLDDPSATAGELGRAFGDLMLSSGAVALVSMIGTVFATALLTSVTSRAVLGKPVTTAEAWRDARPRLPKLFGLVFLLMLTGAAILAVGVLPGVLVAVAGSAAGGAALGLIGGFGASLVAIWVLVRFSLASPALMLEKQGVRKSLKRSVKLVHGSWWRIFGIQLLATVIANVVASIIVIPFALVAAALSGDGIGAFVNGTGGLGWTFLVVSGVGAVIGSMLTLPINAGVTVLLYIDQRIRREALDLDLARAAGVQGYGAGTTGAMPGS